MDAENMKEANANCASSLAFRAFHTFRAFLAAAFISILFLFTISATIPFSSAEIAVQTYSTDESFHFSSPIAVLQGCSCQTLIDSFKITNTGAVPVLLTLTSSMPVRFSESFFALSPGDSREVVYLLDAACDKTYNGALEIYATSSSGKVQTMQKQLQFGKCQNIAADVALKQDPNTLNPCQAITGNLTVQNTASFTDTYLLSLKSPEMVSGGLSKEILVLQPQQFAVVPFSFSFNCAFNGRTTASFEVESQRNGMETSIPLILNVQDNYPYSIEALNSGEVCALDKKEIVVQVSNGMPFEETFSFSFKSAQRNDFIASYSPSQFTVPAGQKFNVALFLSPLEGDEGNYIADVQVAARTADLKKTLSIPVNVNSCYLLSMELADDPSPLCSGTISRDLVVKNTGAFTENVSLQLRGPDFISLSENGFTLKSGEEKKVTLRGQFPDATQFYGAEVTASLSNGVSAAASSSFNIVSQESCYSVSGEKGLNSIGYSRGQNITVSIASSALQDEIYLISLESPVDWIVLETAETSASKGSNGEVVLVANPTNESLPGSYTVTVVAVPLSNPGISYSLPVQVELARPPFVSRAFSFLASHLCTQIAMLLTFIFLVAAVIFVGLPKQKPSKALFRKNRIQFRVMLTIFVLFAIFMLLLVQGIRLERQYPAIAPSADALSFTWYSDEQYSIDLSQYFFSPEFEQLEYSASPVSGIEARIEGNVATFIPERGFSGRAVVEFTATDEGNHSAKSPLMKLEVVRAPGNSLAEYVGAYCEAYNILLIGLVFFLVWLSVIIAKRNTSKDKR